MNDLIPEKINTVEINQDEKSIVINGTMKLVFQKKRHFELIWFVALSMDCNSPHGVTEEQIKSTLRHFPKNQTQYWNQNILAKHSNYRGAVSKVYHFFCMSSDGKYEDKTEEIDRQFYEQFLTLLQSVFIREFPPSDSDLPANSRLFAIEHSAKRVLISGNKPYSWENTSKQKDEKQERDNANGNEFERAVEVICLDRFELLQKNQQLESELQELKEEFQKAVERAHYMEQKSQNAEALEALEQVRESGNTTRLLKLLLQDRDARRDVVEREIEEIVKRDWEIIAVALVRGDIDIASEAVDEILKYKPTDCKANYRKGFIEKIYGRLQEAEKYFKITLEQGQLQCDLNWQATASKWIGMVCGMRGEMMEAEEMLQEAIRIRRELPDTSKLAGDYNSLGMYFRSQGQMNNAEEMFNNALEMHQNSGEQMGIAACFVNIGNLYRIKGDLDKAEQLNEQALRIYKELDNKHYIAYCMNNLGLIYVDRGDFDRAETLFRDAIAINQKQGRTEGIIKGNNHLAFILKTTLVQDSDLKRS